MLWLESLLRTFVKPWSVMLWKWGCWGFYLLKGKLENNVDNWWMVYFCDWNKKKVNLGSCLSACLWECCLVPNYLGSYAAFLGGFGVFFGHIFLQFIIVCSNFVHLFQMIVNWNWYIFLSLSGIGFLHKHCCYLCCHWLCGSHFPCYII